MTVETKTNTDYVISLTGAIVSQAELTWPLTHISLTILYVENATASVQHWGNASFARIVMTKVLVSSDVMWVGLTHKTVQWRVSVFVYTGSFLY